MRLLLLLLGCPSPTNDRADDTAADSPADTATDSVALPSVAADADLVPLDTPRLARRMSLDIRGVLPTVAELDAVEADPTQLGALRDAWLDDPRFEQRFMYLLGERWLTRVDEFLIYYMEYRDLSMDPRNEYPFERAIGDEPLRLMAHVAATDQPWTDIVTADWSMGNEVLGPYWPTDYPREGQGWQVIHYTDGRPAAGVLATNGLWWRYYSTFSNMNRGRAAALARLLLCEDYLSRPVSFTNQVALVDEEGVESALRSNPYCMGCHSSLDPLASTLFGFWVANEYAGPEMERYHPEREPLGSYQLGLDPEFYGLPMSGLGELGAAIAADGRFSRCAAESMAEVWWRRPVTIEDFDRVEDLRQAYLAGGERMKPLLAAVTDTPVYRAGGLVDGVSDEVRDREATVRLLDATLLDSVLEDLSGFGWEEGGFRMLDDDSTGFRIMGGGVDGIQVTRPQRTPNLTWALTVERAAEGAADDAVAELGSAGTLLAGVDATTQPGDPAFTTTLDQLHWHLYAQRPDDAWRSAVTSLWQDVAATEGPTEAWKAVLVAMLRDPLFVSY